MTVTTDTQSGAAGDLPLFQFDHLSGVNHGISTRLGGASAGPYSSLNLGMSTGDDPDVVLTNRDRFARAVGTNLERVFVGRLSHGNAVTVFDDREWSGHGPRHLLHDSSDTHRVFRTDAVISNLPSAHFLLTFADCVPLLFMDGERGVVGAAHAGWRGTEALVGPNVVRTMTERFGTDPGQLQVGIGPSIGPCCFAVQEDVLARFKVGGVCGKWEERDQGYVDLWGTNYAQLCAAGVSSENIRCANVCTRCNSTTFFSHRAEGPITGRFAACIGLP